MLKFASFLALLLLVAATRAEPLLGPSELEEQEDGELLIEDQLIEDQEDGEFLVEEQEGRELAYEDWVGNERKIGYGWNFASLESPIGRSSDYGPNDRYAPYPNVRNERKPSDYEPSPRKGPIPVFYAGLESPIGRSSDYGPNDRYAPYPEERNERYPGIGYRKIGYGYRKIGYGYRIGRSSDYGPDDRYAPYPEERNERKPSEYEPSPRKGSIRGKPHEERIPK